MITDSGHPRDYKGKRKPLESLLESPSPNIPTPNSSPSSFANIPVSIDIHELYQQSMYIIKLVS